MKKIFCVAFAAVAAAFAGCSKNETPMPESTSGAPEVRITLQNESSTRGVSGDETTPSTRAFFDESATGEEWENKINSLTIHAYSPQGILIMKRKMTAEELAAKSAKFALPRSMAGQDCTFFVVANADYTNVATIADIEKSYSQVPITSYNVANENQTSRDRQRAGFVMEGKSTAKIASSGATTVGITLRRTVAKIAVRAAIDPSFTKLYGGTVSIKSLRIVGVETFTYSGDKAVFYLYESPADKPVSLVVLGTYIPATGAQAVDLEYRITLTGSGDGSIKRNGYYRVDAVIKGFTEGDLNVNFTIANWEIPITQNVNFGK